MIEYTVEVDKDGTKRWYLNGKRHREGEPAVEYEGGINIWYLNGKVHREDGPAATWANGKKEWYLNGQRHREDGPAIEWADGDKEWWIHGKEVTEQDVMGESKSLVGKLVIIDGVEYVLVAIQR